MKLKAKLIDLEAGGRFIVVINEKDAKKLGINPLDRVILSFSNKELVAIVNTAEKTINEGEIGVFEEVSNYFKLKDNEEINVRFAERPSSIEVIKKKLNGEEISKEEITKLIKDIVKNRLSEVEIAYFVASSYIRGMSLEEVYHLTKAIVSSGKKLNIKAKVIADKHSIGGVPGNRVTMILVPIIASLGIKIPKTSSRAITSPAGTADTMEVLANVNLSKEEVERVVNKVNGCIVWGGALNLAPADDKIIKVEYPLRIDPEAQLLASIMAKKLSVNATHVVIDIPLGENAKVTSIGEARHLERQFIRLGKKLKMNVKPVVTDGSEPIGNGIGPCLEAKDVLEILENKKGGNLKEKSLLLVGHLLKLLGKVKDVNQGIKIGRDAIKKGKALKKFREIIREQGGNEKVKSSDIPLASYRTYYLSSKSGRVDYINNSILSKIARILGAPADKEAGVYLHKHVGEKVKENEKLLTLYANSENRLDSAIKALEKVEVIRVV